MKRYLFFVVISLFLLSFARLSELPTEKDKENYLLPQFNELELGNPIMIRDTALAQRIGMLSFHAPLGDRHGSCAGCHKIEKAGHSIDRFHVGNMGLFDVLMAKYRPVKLDLQTVKTPPVINAFSLVNTLWGAELGKNGLNSGVPIERLASFKPQNTNNLDGVYIQADVGFNAHDIGAMVEKCRHDTFFVNLAKEAFFVEDITKQLITTAIGVYEKSIIPHEAPFQKWLRGETERLRHYDGFKLFEQHCTTCHTGKAFGNESLGMAIGQSDFEGRKRMTGKDSDYRVLKVPQLYNLKDAPSFFHSSDDISLYKAVKNHNLNIKKKDIRKIVRFVRNDLYDPNMKRFLEY